jgi:hypothetical protein
MLLARFVSRVGLAGFVFTRDLVTSPALAKIKMYSRLFN